MKKINFNFFKLYQDIQKCNAKDDSNSNERSTPERIETSAT
jgi:hypothetical protein